ncbi:hypothetical protein G6O67_002651 [Ophiocordyceps sinensis]|uniref:GPI inositol-deacylase winged helix domain-containing protein n=1 Tax=Ophiocordyceps sinensis TaxID=72228 RepID=A0A8H4V7S7_9HYPO|nr:hypothetical protein G6O67_002651 [Ophiocordyceps sinensis]
MMIEHQDGNSVERQGNFRFLLAKLHLDSLMDKTSVKAIRSALEELPKGSGAYNEAFEMAMKRVETQAPGHRALAKQALAWIVCAKRPLNTLELQHALAVEACHTRFEQEALPDIEIMVSVCAGLIVMDKKSQFVRPVHYTTQQYFAETRTAWFPEAEVDITNKSFGILSSNTQPRNGEIMLVRLGRCQTTSHDSWHSLRISTLRIK